MTEQGSFGNPGMPSYRVSPHVETVIEIRRLPLYRKIADETSRYPKELEKMFGRKSIQVVPYLSEGSKIDNGERIKIRIIPPGAEELLRLITKRVEGEESLKTEQLISTVVKRYLNIASK